MGRRAEDGETAMVQEEVGKRAEILGLCGNRQVTGSLGVLEMSTQMTD